MSHRLSQTCLLRPFSDLTVAAIAFEVGIDHVSHFIDLFKKRVDMTPLAYRKRWQGP
ncbi:AraC family transcriptional regulator [Brevibacillus sp. AY1]|nr:AraC family transcriptional regulator [Brevibacillus sp. AY1]